MKDCKKCFFCCLSFSRYYMYWHIVLFSSNRQRGECTDDYLFATGEIKGYKTACEKVDTML